MVNLLLEYWWIGSIVAALLLAAALAVFAGTWIVAAHESGLVVAGKAARQYRERPLVIADCILGSAKTLGQGAQFLEGSFLTATVPYLCQDRQRLLVIALRLLPPTKLAGQVA